LAACAVFTAFPAIVFAAWVAFVAMNRALRKID
jgi:hypothetical protein